MTRPKRAKQRRVWPWFVVGMIVGSASSAVLLTQKPWLGDVSAAIERFMADEPARTPARARQAEGEARTKPRFEFYTMLPEMEVAVPEEEIAGAPRVPDESSPTPGQVRSKGAAYILQVGSFRARTEAERLKAELALLGLQAAVQSVVIDGKNTWHRVRVGPYSDLGALAEDRTRLRENRYEAMVLRIRTDG